MAKYKVYLLDDQGDKIRRMTYQKSLVYDYLKQVKTHPTAEEVYGYVKQKIPTITLATVYRNLNNLFYDGVINRFTIGSEFHYDADISIHSHFVCLKCGAIYDVDWKPFRDFAKKAMSSKTIKNKYGEIRRSDFFMMGVCKKCSLRS